MPLIKAIFSLVDLSISLYILVIFFDGLFKFLLSYGFVKSYNSKFKPIQDLLEKLSYPVLDKVRKHVPLISGIDITYVVVLFALVFIQKLIRGYGLV
jgi:YggT family protein